MLLEYFQGEGQAIRYLEKVSARALVRLTHEQRQLMLADKVQDDPFIRGPNFKWTDDMWWYIYELAQNLDFNTPPGPKHHRILLKRKHYSEDDPEEFPCEILVEKHVRFSNF